MSANSENPTHKNNVTVTNDWKYKLKRLWTDKRRYSGRLLLSALASLCLCFTFIFFGPLEISATNTESLVFTLSDVVLVMSITAVASFAFLTFLLPLLRGKIFNYALTAMFSLTVCGYIQGVFLNGALGSLTGDAIAWQNYKPEMLLNLLIWIVIFLIPYIVLYFSEKGWGLMIKLVSSALVIMQLAGLISLFITESSKWRDPSQDGNGELYLTQAEMFDYSAKGNTLVFLLDRLDYDFVQEVIDDTPHFFDRLDGFTSYVNATSEFARTLPAANYILTGCEENVYRKPTGEFLEESWNQGNKHILEDLKSSGYSIDIYSTVSSMFGNAQPFQNYVSNLSNNERRINNVKLVKNMLYLSAYRYALNAVKPFFWCYTDDINNGVYASAGSGDIYEIDETKYLAGISDFSLYSDTKYFKFFHFNGPHPPWTLNSDGTRSASGSTTSLQQTKGSFNILFAAFDKLKELGIYKDTTIIILADHGSAVSDSDPLLKATRIGMFYKPAGSEGTPLVYSEAPVSNGNVPATILKSAGLDYSEYGTPLDEIAVDADITRHFYKSVVSESGHEKKVYYYEIKGDAANFTNWVNTDIFDVTHWFY